MRLMFEEVRRNKIKSIMLLLLFIVIIGLLGALAGNFWYGDMLFGLAIAVSFSIIYSIFSWFSGDKMVLNMSGARPVTKEEYPYLFHTVEGLALAAGIPTPKAYVIEDSALNAFATGRDPEHAAVAVTTGFLESMDRQELEGVIAHEMSHILNFDIRFMMLTVVMVGIVTLLSDFILRSFGWGRGRNRSKNGGKAGALLLVVGILLAALAPIIGNLIRLAISRGREYMADANAAILTRYPPGLAGALRKIAGDPDPLVDKANKATAHLFISTPFRKETGYVAKLFSTHPPIEERIRRLEEM